ncbi:unnamed protein product [marine sediment metagenome]|uniref:Uncharacterized protein n=1 Tax=marine sediment metagenome TaxID=412755 RepID=X1C8B7_9ZZZZ
MQKHTIFNFIGIGLLVLGGISGFSLFIRAVVGKEKFSEGWGIGTLWGLFIIGLVAGITILAISW